MTFFRVLCAAFGLAAASALAAPGDLDPSYGANGVAPFKLAPGNDIFGATALQPDGRIVSAGTTLVGGTRRDLALTRHMPDGTLDASFGQGGRVVKTHPVATAQSDPPLQNAVIGAFVLPSAKILVASRCNVPLQAQEAFCLARFNANGTADTGFGSSGNGWAPTIVLTCCTDRIAVGVRADGRILYATTSSSAVQVRQLDANGSPDGTFGSFGTFTFNLASPRVWDVAVQGDGNVLVSGRYQNGSFVARVLANGSALDPAFGLLGSGVAPSSGGTSAGARMALEADGRILVGGCSSIERLDTAGNSVGAFGTQFSVCDAAALAIGADGSVAAAGVERNAAVRLHLFRMTGAGTPLPGFGAAGHVQRDLPIDATTRDLGLLVQGDGAVVAGVTLTHEVAGGQSTRDFGLARVLANGANDATFGSDGLVATDLLSSRDGTLVAARRMADGRVVALFRDGGQPYWLVRLLADGTSDPTLVTNLVTLPVGSGNGPYSMSTLAVQPDGKILVGITQGDLNAVASVMRLNPDGSRDTAFGTDGRTFVYVDGDFPHAAGIRAIEIAADGTIGLAITRNTRTFVALVTSSGTVAATREVQVALNTNALTALALQSDGKWIAAGVGTGTNGAQVIVARLVGGDYDPDYGVTGRVLAAPFAGLPNPALTTVRVLIAANGNAIVVGNADAAIANGPATCRGTNKNFVTLLALDAQGNPDGAFGTSGRVVTDFGVADAYVEDAVLDDSGRLLLIGYRRSTPSCQAQSWFLARFTAQGMLDASFGSGGIKDFELAPNATPTIARLYALPDGRTLGVASTVLPELRFATFRLQGEVPTSGNGDFDGDGIPDGVEASVGRNPGVKDNDVFGEAQLFAMQQYRDFLGREGDASGVVFWRDRITLGTHSRGQVIESFFGSQEFQGAIAPVARLYFAFFLRIPDYAGLNFWIGYYRAGNSLEAISNAFAGSAEFQATYGPLDNGQFVTLAYQNVLGRAPDAGGYDFWKNELDTGARSRGQVMLGFSESGEYRASSDSMVYVTMMYFGMLRRSPDQGGFDFWVQYRNSGNSGLTLIDAFLNSLEYHDRFLP